MLRLMHPHMDVLDFPCFVSVCYTVLKPIEMPDKRKCL
jgi:hypothetical protein